MSGECWCAEEPVRLPMPAEDADCLCRDCLRKLGAAAAAAASGDPTHLD
jgi:hypothetical protein